MAPERSSLPPCPSRIFNLLSPMIVSFPVFDPAIFSIFFILSLLPPLTFTDVKLAPSSVRVIAPSEE